MSKTRTGPPLRHEERTVFVDAFPENVFAFADDHEALAEHMGASSWVMLGGRMNTTLDDRHGQEVGSHVRMSGQVLGIPLDLDEVVVERVPPWEKAWGTVGVPRLLVIGRYRMGFEVLWHEAGVAFRTFIDYELPGQHRCLGYLLGEMYARWCVDQLSKSVTRRFGAADERSVR